MFVHVVIQYMYQLSMNLCIVIGVLGEYGEMKRQNLNSNSWKNLGKQTTSKYKNKKVVVDNILFDSKKEANYYTKLKILKDAGKITDLELQKKFILQDKFTLNSKTYRAITYVADFVYKENGQVHVVDTKGYRTQVYKIKKKLFMKKYGIEIEEV